MIKSLDDPYSTYMDKKEASSFHESISSSFEGIGAEIQEQDGKIMVVSPIKGSPAEKAGVKPNDIILSVNGKSVEGLSSSEAVLKIRGKKERKWICPSQELVNRNRLSLRLNVTQFRLKQFMRKCLMMELRKFK